MTSLNVDSLPDCKPRYPTHWFGFHIDRHDTLFGVKTPFAMSQNGFNEVAYKISFDFIESDFPFLISLLTLMAMQANINISSFTLGLRLHNAYKRFSLGNDCVHIYLLLKLRYAPAKNANHTVNQHQHRHPRASLSDSNRVYYCPPLSKQSCFNILPTPFVSYYRPADTIIHVTTTPAFRSKTENHYRLGPMYTCRNLTDTATKGGHK